tara:strand:+ start:3649 stop:5346 length:1698 start_codon:yes stop_codon:yes gene_type:complete
VNLSKPNNQIHFYFISLLSIHYLIPIIFVGQIIVSPLDSLDIVVVYDHIISEIYKGNIEKLGYLLSGEIKWYYLEKLFYPINILQYFLEDKIFYFTNGILEKLISYFSFYLLSKSLNISKFNSALGGILYSIISTIYIPFGLALPFLPYILYLLINKNSLNKKHYLVLFLIGLNSSLAQDIFAFILLIPLSFILKEKNFTWKIQIRVLLAFMIPLILTSLHILIGSLSEITTHREAFDTRLDLITSFTNSVKIFFLAGGYNMYIFKLPLAIILTILLIWSFFSNQKKIKLIFYFIILVLILKTISDVKIIEYFFVGILNFLKGFNFARIDRILPLLLALLFIFYITSLKNKNLKKFIYVLSFFSIISVQLMIPVPTIGEYFLKKNMTINKFNETKKNISENNFIQAAKIILNSKNYSKSEMHNNLKINKTFDNYYQFSDYAFIKNIVKNSTVMSVGLDPMIAVMNDMRAIDGYHTIYPMSYKIKFRKVIEKELENNDTLKNYYDKWGSRVYTFYNDKNNLLLNFKYAKKIGADFVISKFPIEHNDLKVVCYECNNSRQIFLYRIL